MDEDEEEEEDGRGLLGLFWLPTAVLGEWGFLFVSSIAVRDVQVSSYLVACECLCDSACLGKK